MSSVTKNFSHTIQQLQNDKTTFKDDIETIDLTIYLHTDKIQKPKIYYNILK